MSTKIEHADMSFWEHLMVLRGHVLRMMIAIFILSIIGFVYREWIFTEIIFTEKSNDFWLFQNMCSLSKSFGWGDTLCVPDTALLLQNLTMAGQFNLSLWAAFFIGLILSFPFILWEIWRFIKPGLRPEERKLSGGFVWITSILFFLGVLFGYFVIVPFSVQFLANFKISEMVTNNFTLDSYLKLVLTLALSCGLIFELPVLMFFLTKLGLVNSTSLKAYRKHAVVGTLILAALITPPDFLSQILVTLPVLLLYECGIWIARKTEKL